MTNDQMNGIRWFLAHVLSDDVVNKYILSGQYGQYKFVWVPATIALLAAFLRTDDAGTYNSFVIDCMSY